MIELLSPAGDFECIKAAVQNGADAVYFGASSFSARAFATNFDKNSLENAINYCKIRGVKTNLTLNTLIKNNEFSEAIDLASKAYSYGIDAIIVQDLGLAEFLIKNFPDLSIHGSTQMTVHNLAGVLELANRGFKRVVLARELSLDEISYICKNSPIEIEVFIHGALCISYSGDCLFSSMIGGRSGNRGKCAQPCRLPYTLLENEKKIDSGYLLSPRDLCSLEFLPQLINSGVTSFKIEGRMKTPEYVATVTRIYRKYIDSSHTEIEAQDKKDLLQVFNRGGFSTGHLANTPNKNLIYPEKPNNMGIFLGEIHNFSPAKGHISLTLNDTVEIGDKIAIQNKTEEANYTVSELMKKNTNLKIAHQNEYVTLGRMKGSIKEGNKVYKIASSQLSDFAKSSYSSENIKRDLFCEISVKRNEYIFMKLYDNFGISLELSSAIKPVEAINSPITKERIIAQISKTNNTPYFFTKIDVILDDNLYISPISSLNELRRQALAEYEQRLLNSFKRQIPQLAPISYEQPANNSKKCISILLNILNLNYDYSNLENVDNVYIPLKYFFDTSYYNMLDNLCKSYNVYIYMPHILRKNYLALLNNLDNILQKFLIKGFVLSNIGQFHLLKKYEDSYIFVGNYNLNVFNDFTANCLHCSRITVSPELDNTDYLNITNSELIVYGSIPLMTSNYCLLGKSNHCYGNCSKRCNSCNTYSLIDRKGAKFRFIPDNIDTITTIFNCKKFSLNYMDYPVSNLRLDFLDEPVDEIRKVVSKY